MTREKLIIKFFVAIFLFLVFVQTLYGTYKKSVTWDELCYIGTGNYLLKTGDFKYNALIYHPPMSFYINSIFLTFLKFNDEIYKKGECFQVGNEIIFHSGYNSQIITLLARLPIIFMSVVLALFVFKWATSLYGIKSGMFALIIYTFNTTILSFGGLALTDFVAAFFIFITLYSFWVYLKTKSTKGIIATGISLGLALMSKATSLILVPSLIFAAYFYRKQQNANNKIIAKNLLTIALIGMLVMFVGYGFKFDTLNNTLEQHYNIRAHQEIAKLPNIPKKALSFIFDNVPLPFPNYFAELGSVTYYSNLGVSSFIFGRVTEQAVWYLPIVVLVLKTHPALLAFLILALLFLKKKDLKKDFMLLLPILLIFILFMMNNRTSGVRHLLAVYPFAFVFASRILTINVKYKKIFSVFIGISLVYYILSTLLVAPHFLAYYNELAGGPANGYKYIAGSNVDLGQDLIELKSYMDKNKIAKIKLSYFGSVDPKEYNITYEYLASPYFQYWVPDYKPYVTVKERSEDCSKKNGYIAISVNNLQNVHMINKTCFNWLKNYEPIAKIGYSIFIYDITDNKN